MNLARLLTVGFITGVITVSMNACSPTPAPEAPSLPERTGVRLDSLGVGVGREENRPVSFTNKRSAYFYTQTHRNDHPEHAGFSGLNIAQRRAFSGYDMYVGGVRLDPELAEVTVYPDRMERRWANGATEVLRMLDQRDVIEVELAGAGEDVQVVPLGEGVALLGHQEGLRIYSTMEIPGRVVAAGRHGERHYLVVAESPAAALAGFEAAETRAADWRGDREQRLAGLLNRHTYVQADDPALTSALRWLLITMDQLVTRQRGEGIYAGLPWFNEYWGRDSFIALPGALLVTGEFETARAVLTSFAEFMDMDTDSKFYGRVPNRVRPDDLDYHTTDGTPRFVIALLDYVRYSGDTSIIDELYPSIRASIEGALANWTDPNGYLTHEENETWMDARRASDLAAYSPRDTRANDIQALWHAQLLAGVYFANTVEDAGSARRWQSTAERLAKQFGRDFTSPDHDSLADRLDADDIPDFSQRPNQFYAFDMLNDPDRVARATRKAWETLVYPWGVASLAASDPFFHPYHLAWQHYHKDEAYHNGTVWLWNNGIAMQRMIELGQVEPAWRLFKNMNRQVLEQGVVGGLAENTDAYPHPGETWPRLTGTYLQAWSNSEQLRTWYQYFLGVRPDMVRNTLMLAPRLPKGVGSIDFTARAGAGTLRGIYRPGGDLQEYSWLLNGLDSRLQIDLTGFPLLEIDATSGSLVRLQVQPGHGLDWHVWNDRGEVQASGSLEPDQQEILRQQQLDKLFEGIDFAQPGDPARHPVMHQVNEGR